MQSNANNTNIVDKDYSQQRIDKQEKLKKAKYLISSLLAILGIVILASQLGPLAVSYINGKILESQINTIKDPAPTHELSPQDNDLPYYDPGMSYFQNVMQHIGGSTSSNTGSSGNESRQEVTIDKDYSRPMKLSIESIDINQINITPNVDSFNETIYDKALKNGLAHFKGTPLPGDGGNSFIYGHSAVDTFFSKNPDNPETIFSKLENVEISDTVIIYKDSKQYEYTVQKKKIAQPNNFDVVSGIDGKETVTLMTCWPLGIGSQRLIVIGELVNGK
jgi:LPXTG-site transpeptidase (sortase) family protein